jgi:hypothetical protein
VQEELDGRRAVAAPDQHSRVVGIVGERLGTAGVLLAGSVKALDGGAVVGTAHPRIAGPELEARDLRCTLHGIQRREQRGHIHTIEGRAVGSLRHGEVSRVSMSYDPTEARQPTFPAPSAAGARSF